MNRLQIKSSISTKLVLLLLFASLLPLAFFGALSLWQVRQATIISVTEGNTRVGKRAAEQIQQYVYNALTLLKSTAENINHADLKDWQKERILKNYLNRFDEFNELTIRNPEGTIVATSRLSQRKLTPIENIAFQEALKGHSYLSDVFIREDLSPAMVTSIPIKRLAQINGVLLAELNLLHMWYLVDSIKIGEKGILHVIGNNGRLIATGDGHRKKEVFQEKPFEPADQIPHILQPTGQIFTNPLGVKVIAVGTELKEPLSWNVIVEQPTSEAYALASRMTYWLAAIVGAFLLLALVVGFYGGKQKIVDPIRTLSRATEQLARGNLDYRVSVQSGDEFEELGTAFNNMAKRLKEVQEKLIREERHAMFGRIASGLAHDLKHPIQAIETSSRLMDKMYDDNEFRETFRKTVAREFAKINAFLSNLHNLTSEIPHRAAPIKVSNLLKDTLATFETIAKKKGIQVDLKLPPDNIRIEADPTSLNRAFSNLISNAFEAMEGGGTLTLSTKVDDGSVEISVQDTGKGIEASRLNTLFDDFITTKHRGLGLGLPITKKIIAQHQGQLQVVSEVGKGTCFRIRLPRIDS